MTPNDFGIIRQADHNLFAYLFPPLTDISEYQYELVWPEYIDGQYVAQNAIIYSPDYAYAITDVSKYDYILVPTSRLSLTPSSAVYIGIKDTNDISGGFTKRLTLFDTSSPADTIISCLALLERTGSDTYLFNTVLKSYKLPLIGFYRHRNDHVNPLGIILPINPGILQPGSLEPAVEDPDVQEEDLTVEDPEEQEEP